MKFLSHLSILAAPPVEFPPGVMRAVTVAGYSQARDMLEAAHNAERMAAWRMRYAEFRAGDFVGIGVPAPSVSRIKVAAPAPAESAPIEFSMSEIAEAVKAAAPPPRTTLRLAASSQNKAERK